MLVLGILGFVYSDSVSSSLQEELVYGIKNHYNASSDFGIFLAWDHIQNEVSPNQLMLGYSFKCCFTVELLWSSQL